MKSIFIIGPSGSGKSTLAQYLKEVYKAVFGEHSVGLVNLDPANPSNTEESTYDVDINNLITIEDIMEEYQVGPNGAMLYAMQFLEENKHWLLQQLTHVITNKQPHYRVQKQMNNKQALSSYPNNNPLSPHPSVQQTSPFYLIFDLPGQVQLYLQNSSTKNLIFFIQNEISPQTCILQLFDSTYIYQVSDFIALCMMSLSTMINLEMPHINVLNKIDVIKGNRPALGMLNQYLDVGSMKGMVEDLIMGEDLEGIGAERDDNKSDSKITISKKPPPSRNHQILTSLSSILDQYNQVSFIPLSVFKIQLIKYLILQIQLTFNSHQINKYSNPKYLQFTKSVDRSMAKEQLITELQNELFKDEQQEEQQEKKKIEKGLEELKKELEGKGKSQKAKR